MPAWTSHQLLPRHFTFISSLPYSHSEFGATFVHASAAVPERWDYLGTSKQIKACMQAADTNLTFIGHVHIPSMFYENSADKIRELHPQQGISIPLFRNRRYVVNVGPVDQPRDGNNAACFVIYDVLAGELTFHRVVYDYTYTAQKILDANLDPYFAERLASGC